MSRSWRGKAAPIIAGVISDHKGDPEKEIRKALREAYPWGSRTNWPYKVWCSEINRQLRTTARKEGDRLHAQAVSDGQIELPL